MAGGEVGVVWPEGTAQEGRGIVHVTLRHPGRLNAMSRAMWRQLREVFEAIQARADARCVLIEGEGEAFCAGGDISEYPSFRFDPGSLRDFHEGDVWGGLKSGMLKMAPYLNMPDDVKALAEQTEEGIKSGQIQIFRGPIKAQDGSAKVADGQLLDDGAIAGMDWLADGIEGQLPK